MNGAGISFLSGIAIGGIGTLIKFERSIDHRAKDAAMDAFNRKTEAALRQRFGG